LQYKIWQAACEHEGATAGRPRSSYSGTLFFLVDHQYKFMTQESEDRPKTRKTKATYVQIYDASKIRKCNLSMTAVEIFSLLLSIVASSPRRPLDPIQSS